MAEEVPICEVLCEAMEYLSKLGSNLRQRSDTLKEKRIRKDKLRNSHAVQKAANKVLLICQLSKKSLENVETGVKKILDRVGASQRPLQLGAKTSKSDEASSSEIRPSYHYFEYDKRKLRVAKKISIGHFMSVKVLAKKMPKSMQDRYPVYYDCKLYRIRKSLERAEKSEKEKQTGENVEIVNNKQDKDLCKDSTNNYKIPKIKPSESEAKSEPEAPSKDEFKEEKIKDSIQKKRKASLYISSDSDSEKRSIKSLNDVGKTSTVSQKKNVIETGENRISSKTDDVDEKSHTKERNSQKSPSKHKRVRIIHDSDSDSEKNNKAQSDKDECDKPETGVIELKQKNENDEDENSKSEEAKPLLKLVNINKLLKPDLVKEKEPNNKPQKISDTNGRKANNNKDIKKNQIEKQACSNKKSKCSSDSDNEVALREKRKKIHSKPKYRYSSDSDDEAYWKEKREEVKAFIPKTFSIIVSRLPPISDEVLHKYNLKKITKNSITICEILDHEGTNSQNSLKDSEVDTVKNALLQDSDSEKSDNSKKNLNKTAENKNPDKVSFKTTVKQSLAKKNESENITLDKSNSTLVSNEIIEKRKLSDEDEQIEETKKGDQINKKNDEIKSSLLNDSSNDNEIFTKEKKSDKNLSTQEKHAKEQEIKSSLLNDSSSDSKETCNKEKQNKKLKNCEGSKGHPASVPKNDKNPALLQDITDSSVKSSSNKSDTDAKKDKEEQLANDQEIKSSLLNDSSSDSKETCNKEKQNKKETNFKESKEQPSSVPENDNEGTAASKEKILSPNEDQNKIKSALLNDSSSEAEKSPSAASSIKTTPQSKRKHIMESMHAKKMLLTYSSSSETEDENLNRVLKGIKDELLRGISSEEEDELKTKCINKGVSSDSEENIVTRAKKKGKLVAKKKCRKRKKSSSDDDVKSGKKSDSSRKKMGRSGDSGSSSSDTQDNKVIDGLTNLSNLNKPRRRRGSSDNSEDTHETTSSTSKRKSKMPRSPLITGEGLLEAPTSSEEEEAASGAESEIIEELPSVPMSSLNGDGIQEHLAKDDLLEESDSSKSSDEDDKKDETDSEGNIKKKRRKANTISSDSEAGSSRRKSRDNDADARLSDFFEDSEDDSSEPAKKNKSKRKKSNDSDGSGSSSNEGKKKRRRIKQLDSEGSGSESETEGRNKHGRKNIRKVMGKSQLEEATKKAAREEKERLARIAERQKMYNNVEFDETGKPDEVVVDKVVLDFDPETKEPLIEVDRGLVKKLKPHQANGIKFMWDACFESVKRIKKDKGSGCILAHCMGLGKTLQVVSLTHTLLTHAKLTGVNRVLVVCPLSTVLNWVNEFRMWLQHAEADYDLDIYELSKFKQNSERAFQLSQWLQGGGVCVLGYEMFRNLSADNPKKFKKKLLRHFQESLVDPGPDLVVCDEGHLLKNEKTSLSQSMNRVKTRRRIVLTGTPLQNNLKEYYCMVQFVKPNLLGKYNEYLNRFVNPITNGQYTDSTEHDIRVMKRRSHVLHKMLDGAVQRRDYGVLAPFLPPKHEYVLFITLTEIQIKLYQHYLDNYSRRPLPGKSSGFLFPDFQSLQRIWTHPLVLKYNSERYEIMQQKKREREEEDDSEGSLVDFIDDDSTPEESTSAESSDDLSDLSDDSRKKSKKKKSTKKGKKDSKVTTRRGTRANPINQDEEEVKLDDVLEVKNDNPTEWWIPLVTDDEIEDMRNSPKLVLLFDILRQCEAIGDKLLVFSQSLYSLDLIEHFLGKVDEATQEGRIDEKLCRHVGSWSPGVDYFRLDGSTSCENRSIWCKNFNREDNPRARLFLISTRAGGLGINLVAANRVVIFDVSWNPSHDVQSIFRVYRFGQKKPCYIYRFLAMGTMEEKIYERQVTKQAISKRVIDEQQIDRHYAENDLAELYKFEPRPPVPREVPALPKDRLFAEMLKDHEDLIYKFHEHDSLLENKEEETLTEEERKAAWEDFENEKNRPPPVPFSAWPNHNGLMGNLLAQQQQQQLAYAALATMLRKDMPGLTEDQIRNMLPLIYGANPALMQKLNELYKYPQPSMMNPGMMNSMMNPGSGMGGGGTSGLQYEPPWARDMQQQNQMRLQQLMQHQNVSHNSMGAKYYAGGLGSRDPVAMALQQQRAREMLVGERAAGAGTGAVTGAGRPRGRPPLQPRVPPPMPAATDVVNLDSD